ncbi:MAG TPA: isocitrate lyase/PEP mutase family protein [Burkholderiales bacterium]|nr:isocitrate lyase/PEP mutase family protein [Burkholderiales bacterium]
MQSDLNKKLKQLLKPGAGLLLPGAGNALAARIIESVGFPAVYMTGAGLANSYLGAPDMGLTTVTEMAAHIATIREAVDIPIVADGDTGFGNELNMQRTIRLYERSGASAIQIEDQVFPKKCGHFEGKEVIPKDEAVRKIKAAVDAREDSNFLIIARTDARAVEGMDKALERARAYQEAGADVLFVEAPQNIEEMKRICRDVPGNHICNIVFGGKTPMLPREELGAMGFSGILYANAALQAAMLAMKNILVHLKDTGSLAGAEKDVLSFADRQVFVDYDKYKAVENKFR